MKYTGHSIQRRSSNCSRVVLKGTSPFLHRRVECARVVFHRPDATARQILVAAGKQTQYRWNIPFYV